MNGRPHQRITRRELLRQGGAAGAALGIGALGGITLGAPGAADAAVAGGRKVQVTEFIWIGGGQGVVPREVKASFEKANPNVSIELYEGTNAVAYPKMVAQRQVDPNKPLINFGFFNVDAQTKGEKDGMWLGLDPAKVPNMANVYPSYHRPNNTGIGWGFSAVGILYNKKLVKEPPTSWNDIFAPRFKGKVMLFDYAWGFNGLLAVAHANGGDAKHIDVAFEKFSKAAQNGQFLALFTTNEQVKDALARGEALIAPYFTSFAITWNQESPNNAGPFAYAIPKEGVVAFTYYFNAVKGSTPDQIDVASSVINTYLSKPTIERYCNLTATIPAVKGVSLKPDLQKEPVFQSSVIEKAIQPDWATTNAQNDAWKQRWDREVKAKM
ncbi:MAG TPA: ABC transporter substrate-binding protein [bacterium]|nr:ABC transporter substrate-binding protein [bacterium]